MGEIHHERTGAGEPLILIHGLGGTALTWGPVIDRLAAEREVVTIDLPGFGRSPELADGVRPTAANLGRAVTALCRELGIARPHLAGNSLGAWVGLEIAKAGEAASVCGISPAGLWRRPLGPRSVDVRGLARRAGPLLRVALASRRARTALLRTTLAYPERLSRAEAVGLIRGWIDSPGYEAANAEMRSHVFEHPERVTVPTTIAWGELDRLLPRPASERMPPSTRFVVLEGCGHTPTWDDPERVAELLLEASAPAVGSPSAGSAP